MLEFQPHNVDQPEIFGANQCPDKSEISDSDLQTGTHAHVELAPNNHIFETPSFANQDDFIQKVVSPPNEPDQLHAELSSITAPNPDFIDDTESDFDLSAWEAEVELAPPEGDASLAIAATDTYRVISNHAQSTHQQIGTTSRRFCRSVQLLCHGLMTSKRGLKSGHCFFELLGREAFPRRSLKISPEIPTVRQMNSPLRSCEW